jgi:hypothetical protein
MTIQMRGSICGMSISKGAPATSPSMDLPFGSAFAVRFPSATRLMGILIWPLSLVALFVVVRHLVSGDAVGQDSHAYWLAAQGDLSYGAIPGQRDAYLYSPLFVTVIKPLAMLPWPLFGAVWCIIQMVLVAWLVKPLHLRLAIPVALLCTPEMVVGNIYIMLATIAVIGLRWPAAWSFAVLTKVTTGVGLLWFAARGEWTKLFQGIATIVVVVTASYAFDPTAWHAWVQFLFDNKKGTPDSTVSFILRCLAAVVLVVVGARKQWPFLIAPAMVLASPVLVSAIPWTLLVALPRLLMIVPAHPSTDEAG